VDPPRCVPARPDRSDRQATILCIDDDPAIAKIYQHRLQTDGTRVLSARNGHEGYTSALESSPDLILLDNLLPDEEGVHLLGRLRSHPLTADIPVLMLTGSDAASIRRRALLLGVSGVLGKPINFAELIGQIRQLVPSARESG
jgi:DNA-binding response OmpR family regulator